MGNEIRIKSLRFAKRVVQASQFLRETKGGMYSPSSCFAAVPALVPMFQKHSMPPAERIF